MAGCRGIVKYNKTGKPEIISMQRFDIEAPAWQFGLIDKDDELLKSPDGKIAVMTMDEAVRMLQHWIEEIERPIITDIFDNLGKFPKSKTIYIVAPGKAGKDYYKYIPHSDFTIVVNKAIRCPVHAHLWLVADTGALALDWFKWGVENHRDILCLARDYFRGIESPYTFGIDTPPQQILNEDAKIYPGKLRTGGTVTAMAMQLAAQMKPDRIVLCGVDMIGDTYFDGEVVKLYTQEGRNKEWPVIGRLNALVKEIESMGIKVQTLSPTALKVKRIVESDLKVFCAGKDILKSGLRFDGDIYIVGSGPNGKAHYKDIPKDAVVMVVNKAINIADIPKSLWICEDGTLPLQEWFTDAVKRMNTRQFDLADLQNPNLAVPVFADCDAMNGFHASYCFSHDGFIAGAASPDGRIDAGKLYGGATIACRALQIAFQLGAKRIFLCGVDMAGDEYFDGTKCDPKYSEREGGGAWTIRKAFDKVIKWVDKNSECEVYSLSKTALTVPLIKPLEKITIKPGAANPTIAYMSMCVDCEKTIQIAAWCMAQDYPQELKTLYLIHQPPFPEPIRHDLPIKIVELFVNHPWPEGWAFKLKAFANTATEDVMIVFDQDDCWMPDYTRKAIKPLLEGAGIAWNHNMIHVVNQPTVNGEFVDIPYEDKLPENCYWTPTALVWRHQSAIGTLVAWMDKFKIVVDDLMQQYPTGLVYNEVVKVMAGPIDNYFKRLIMKKYNHWLVEHKANGRFYFIHSGNSSKFHKRPESCIDRLTSKRALDADITKPAIKDCAKINQESIKPVIEPIEKELPTIGYLCMTCDPIDMMNAVVDFMNQDYPNEKKKLYLLKQRDAHGDFPPPLVNNLGLQIIEVDCDGYPWPELWTFKVMEYLRVCDCDYTLWFDEDDRYPPGYTRGCLKPILDGFGEIAWSWDCIIAEYVVESHRFEFRECWYRSPVGQMVIKTDLLRKYSDRLWGFLYSGTFKSPKRIRGVPYGGAQDDQLRQMLQRENPSIPHHRAQRIYFIHGQANSAQLRAAGNSIDYRGKRGENAEAEAVVGRFNQDRS